MLKSELGHSVLMRREEKPAGKRPVQSIPRPHEAQGRLARSGKTVHRPSVGRASWEVFGRQYPAAMTYSIAALGL